VPDGFQTVLIGEESQVQHDVVVAVPLELIRDLAARFDDALGFLRVTVLDDARDVNPCRELVIRRQDLIGL